jgi:cell division protein FtsZ
VAEIAGGKGMLTLAVVTKPFEFEGSRKARVAQDAEAALAGLVDAVATIPNDQIRATAPADVTVEDAFQAIDDAVHRNVAEIVEMVAVPGRINLDFADARAVLRGAGAAAVGSGRAAGENRAPDAARAAIAATRLDDGIRGAPFVLVNVSGSRKLRLAELDAVAETVLAATGRETNLTFGVGVRPSLQDELQVTIMAARGGARASAPLTHEPAATAPTATPMSPKPQKAADIAATIPRASEINEKHAFESATDPEGANESESDEWKPVWLRKRAAPPSTPAPDAGMNRSQPTGTSRRERRKRARSHQPEEGA